MIKFMLKLLIDLLVKYNFPIFATVLKNDRKQFRKLFIFICMTQNEVKTL